MSESEPPKYSRAIHVKATSTGGAETIINEAIQLGQLCLSDARPQDLLELACLSDALARRAAELESIDFDASDMIEPIHCHLSGIVVSMVAVAGGIELARER